MTLILSIHLMLYMIFRNHTMSDMILSNHTTKDDWQKIKPVFCKNDQINHENNSFTWSIWIILSKIFSEKLFNFSLLIRNFDSIKTQWKQNKNKVLKKTKVFFKKICFYISCFASFEKEKCLHHSKTFVFSLTIYSILILWFFS